MLPRGEQNDSPTRSCILMLGGELFDKQESSAHVDEKMRVNLLCREFFQRS